VDFYLVRHGEAVSETLDPNRPLSLVGRQQVEQVACAAAARYLRVSEILHSGILRARQTAEILAQHLSPERGARETGGLRPQDDPIFAKAELETADYSLMLVGHLPHMSRLVALLVSGDAERELVDLAPAALICCSHESSAWRIQWMLTPKTL